MLAVSRVPSFLPLSCMCQSSEPKSVCYIETSNIDGETNLKLKEAVAATGVHCPTPADIARLTGSLEYEPPNDRIHTFTGKMQVNGEAFVPVAARNMVLRGCTLRNTKWILGLGEGLCFCVLTCLRSLLRLRCLVVYTGKDTKVMKKSGGARSKMSQVEKTMNNCIKIIFIAQV